MVRNFAEYIDEMKRGCKDFTNNGKCSNCGGCCSRLLWLSTKEIQAIRLYVGKTQYSACEKIVAAKQYDFRFAMPF